MQIQLHLKICKYICKHIYTFYTINYMYIYLMRALLHLRIKFCSQKSFLLVFIFISMLLPFDAKKHFGDIILRQFSFHIIKLFLLQQKSKKKLCIKFGSLSWLQTFKQKLLDFFCFLSLKKIPWSDILIGIRISFYQRNFRKQIEVFI